MSETDQIEIVLVPGVFVNPLVKLEPLDSDDDIHSKDTATEEPEKRVGEIFRVSKNRLKFVCSHCSREFKLFIQFTAHIEQHLLQIAEADSGDEQSEAIENQEANDDSEEVQYVRKFRTKRSKKTKEATIFPCPECGKRFNYLSTMKRHQAVHMKEKCFSCTICDKKFAQRRYVRSHMEIKHQIEENFYRCGKCGSDFTYQWQLKKHLATHDPEKAESKDMLATSFECYMCHDTFPTKRRTRDHLRRHLEQPLFCIICGQFCKTQSSLSRHMDLHQRNTSADLKCDQCPKSFTLMKYLREHRQNVHGVPKYKRNLLPEHKCEKCDKVFGNRIHYRLHLRTHMEDRPYKCDICGWGFFDRGGLNRHQARHTGEKPFTCSICNRSYVKEYEKEHMKIHGGEKKYQCSECGKRFLSSNRLNRHMVCHTMDRKYKCEFCPKSYSRSDKLLAHRRAHTGEYIYKCPVCEKGFTENVALKAHVKRHEKVREDHNYCSQVDGKAKE